MRRNAPTAQLVRQLTARRAALKRWFSPVSQTPRELVTNAVGGNTFRAFQGMDEPPSVLFRAWALALLSHEAFKRRLFACPSETDFDQLMTEVSAGLRAFWGEFSAAGPMPFGPSRKLPNLLMKHLMRWESVPPPVRGRLLQWLHIPWDSYSLRLIAPCLTPELAIPQAATMAWVRDDETYSRLQSSARTIARRAKVPAIYLDVLAWDESHHNGRIRRG